MLETHALGEAIFARVNALLAERGLKVSGGTMVDATIVNASSSTKKKDQSRDPKMHQTKKGNLWHFGMKLHIGADTQSGLIDSADTTAADVHDSQMLPELLHGEERRVYGDSAYHYQPEAIRAAAPNTKDFTNERAQ